MHEPAEDLAPAEGLDPAQDLALIRGAVPEGELVEEFPSCAFNDADEAGFDYGLRDVCQNGLKKADQSSDGARSNQELESAPFHAKEVLERDKNPFFPAEARHRCEEKLGVLPPMVSASTDNSLLAVTLSELQLLKRSESESESESESDGLFAERKVASIRNGTCCGCSSHLILLFH